MYMYVHVLPYTGSAKFSQIGIALVHVWDAQLHVHKYSILSCEVSPSTSGRDFRYVKKR